MAPSPNSGTESDASSSTVPRIILGISDSHDAGAAIIRDGRLVAAINEERLNRRKMTAGLPRLSIPAVLDLAGVAPSAVEAVCVAGRISLGAMPLNNDFSLDDGSFPFAQRLAEWLDGAPGLPALMRSTLALGAYRGVMPSFGTRRRAALQAVLAECGLLPAIAEATGFCDHHDAHLASAYYAAGEADCLVISNDGFGDGLSCKVAVGLGGRLRVISQNSFFNSLGVYYNYATKICGFPKSHHAGKTTGLAAFGDPGRTIEVFRRLIRWDDARGVYVNEGPVFRRALRELESALAGVSREDVAAGIQRHLEEVLVAMARHYIARTGQRRLALVGGVHANVKANQRIAAIPGVEKLFVYPNMGDGGLGAGAAWLAWVHAQSANVVPLPERLQHVYLGPGIAEADARAALAARGLQATRPDDMASAAARRLAAGRIVARAAGAMEYGPRALGNRSILYQATDPKVNAWLNQQLKRTEFMPFAPVIRDEDAEAFFKDVSDRTAHAAEFMTITYDATERCKREAPAVVHVDGTARPQLIRRAVNPDYFDILTAYRQLCGLSVLVNTSFNMHEEPIVCTAEDAVEAFFASNLDSLILGPFLVDNPDRPAFQA